MAGAGQLVAADPVHLVALAFHTRPIGPMATVPGQVVIWTPGKEVYCWLGGTVEQLQVIASSMAGAGQLVAADPHLVALAFDGHGGTGELAQGPGSAGARTSRDLDGLVAGVFIRLAADYRRSAPKNSTLSRWPLHRAPAPGYRLRYS